MLRRLAQKYIRFTRRFRLRDRLSCLFLFATLLPLLLTSFILYTQSSRRIYQNMNQAVTNVNRQATDYIGDKLRKVVSDSVIISNSDIVANVLTNYATYDALRLYQVQKDFQRQMNRDFIYNDIVTEITLYSLDAQRITLYMPYTYRFRPTDTEWEQMQAKCLQNTSKSHFLSLNSLNTMILLRAVRSRESGEPIGCVAMRINERRVSEMYQTAASAGKPSTSLIINREGVIVSAYKQALLNLSDTTNALMTGILAGTEPGKLILTHEGMRWRVHYAAIDGTDLYYVALTDDQLFRVDSDQLGVTLLVTLMGCAAFALFMSLSVSMSIVMPTRRIVDAMTAYKDEKTSISIVDEGKDELTLMSSGFNEMSARLNRTIADIRTFEKQKRVLEIKALQAQINPHFIANTLNMIAAIATAHNEPSIEKLCNSVTALLQDSIRYDEHFVTISGEIKLLKSYLEIQEYRLLGKFITHLEINDDIESFLIPHMVLQPIVENAIIHGLLPEKTRRGVLSIKGDLEDDRIVFTVTDNGVGMTPQRIEQALSFEMEKTEKNRYNNIGCGNVQERIRLLFGEEYGLTVASRPGLFTTVTITLPVLEKEDEALDSDPVG